MSLALKLPKAVLEYATATMNAIGVFEGLRVLAKDGVDPGLGFAHKLRCGEHFWLVPYTEHLSRKRVKVGPPPEAGKLPTILVPELVLLDVLPDFFRTFCQPYRFALQVGNKKGAAARALAESKTEQQMRGFFGQFVNDFLNAWLYRMGGEAWRQIAQMFAAPPAETMARNPITAATAKLLTQLRAIPAAVLPPTAARIAAQVSSLSGRGVDRGRFRWGIEAVLRQRWPHHPFSVQFPQNTSRFARLHPASVTQLGLRCGRLGEDFYLGDEVQQACDEISVVVETSSPTVFQALKPGPLHDAILMIGHSWLSARKLRMDLRCRYIGKRDDMPWVLGGPRRELTDEDSENKDALYDSSGAHSQEHTHKPQTREDSDEDNGRLGYTTFLT